MQQANMAINPAALLPSKIAERAASEHAQSAVADLDEPAHVQPLHNVGKVQFCLFLFVLFVLCITSATLLAGVINTQCFAVSHFVQYTEIVTQKHNEHNYFLDQSPMLLMCPVGERCIQ